MRVGETVRYECSVCQAVVDIGLPDNPHGLPQAGQAGAEFGEAAACPFCKVGTLRRFEKTSIADA